MSENKDVEIIEKAYPMDINFGGVYSPEVTVFRNASDSYAFLDEPYKVGIVSVAALSFNEKSGKDLQYKNAEGGFTPEGLEIMKNKIRKITFAILAKIKSDERFLPFYDLFN